MTNEELTKIAWTRELTNERVSIAAAYWLDCSPHERTEADGIILARYARKALELIDSQAAKIKVLEIDNDMLEETVSEQAKEIERLQEDVKDIKRHLGEEIAGLEYEDNRLGSQLNLAVKALERIEDYWEANIIVKTYARDALSEISRLSGKGETT